MALTTNQTTLQLMQVTPVGSGPMGVMRQAHDELIDYQVDYSGWLQTGDVVTNVTITHDPNNVSIMPVPGAAPDVQITNIGIANNGTLVEFSVSAGIEGSQYRLVIDATLQSGQRKQDEVFVIIGDGSTVYGEGGPQRFTRIAVGSEVDPRYIAKFYGNDILLQNRSSYNGGDGDFRLFLEKFTLLDEAATYYSNNGMPHARSGLIHDDHYSFEVSPDGTTWIRAFEINVATGDIRFMHNINLPLPSGTVSGGVFAEPGKDGYYVRGIGQDGKPILMPFLPPTDADRGMVYAGGPKFNHYVSAITFDGKVQLTAFDPPTSTKLGMVFAGVAPLGQVMTGIDWTGHPIFDNPNGIFVGVFPQDPTQTDVGVDAYPFKTGAIYYNSTTLKPMVWSGVGWEDFWAPSKSYATILYYRATPQQTDFFLGDTDIFQNNYTVDPIDTEPVEVFVNGVRLTPDDDLGNGDYLLDNTSNTITIYTPLFENSAVTIVILTPAAKLAPSSVTIYPLVDFDTDPVTLKPGRIDGTRTMFSMATVTGTPGVNVASAAELLVTCNGGLLKPGIDYTATGSTITFMQPPDPNSVYWAEWFKPGAGGGSGNGVLPPTNPDDLRTNSYDWNPISLGGKGGEWRDNRGDMHSVANAAARLALKDPEEIVPGSMVYERDTHDIWVYTPAGVAGSGAAPVAGTGATGTGGATVRQDINPTPGDPNFKAQIMALHNGDTVFYKGQYYQVTGVPSLGEESFPGGTSYAINPAPFIGQFSPVNGPSWNGYRAPTTPGMNNPATTAATGSTSSAPVAAGDPKLTTNWTMALKGHPTDNILRALEYDPSKPNSMAWEDNRDEMETVPTELDLLNRAVLPASHLTVGKLVYARDTGLLYESLVDGATGTVTGTMADFKTLGGAGVSFVGRIGNLPDPASKTIPDGSLFMVNMDLLGNDYHRLYVFDAKGVNAAGVVGIYRPCATRDFLKSLRSDADPALDAEPGDLQVTLEAGHKELKAYDAAGAWQMVYSEDQTKAWIAAGNLFQGTTQDKGHGTVGAIDLDALPAESALGPTDAGHYFVYAGAGGHVVGATEVGGAASNIAGARLNPGDWLQVARVAGVGGAPATMKWTHIPGDLLAKARGDALYGLSAWTAGAYEAGSLVVYNGDIYKASQPVLATDIAPGVTPVAPAVNPWAKVNISGGVKTVASDTNLPAGAPNGAVYLVLSSAQAGGKGAMYMWDGAASKWQPLSGGGVPMSLSGGKKLINYGSPIGSVIAFAGKVLPAGYKLCDGSTFDQTTFPELFKVLGNSNTLPDLRDQFIRGANTLADVSFVKHDATTGMPKNHFTGVTNSTGSHNHVLDANGQHHHTTTLQMYGAQGGGMRVMYNGVNEPKDYQSSDAGNHTHNVQNGGSHQHTVEIQSGGDPEGTAPKHVVLCYIIKVDDVGVHAL